MTSGKRGPVDENGVDAIARHSRESRSEIHGGDHRNALDLNAKLFAGRFSGSQGRASRGGGGRPEHAEPRGMRYGLLQYLHRLGGEVALRDRQSRNVAAWPRQTCDMSEPNGVRMRREYDR